MRDEITTYLQVVADSRSPRTLTTYQNALRKFSELSGDAPLNLATFTSYVRRLEREPLSPATRALYRAAAAGLFEFYASSHATDATPQAMKLVVKRYVKHAGQRLPNFDRDALDRVLTYAATLTGDLIALRDRAFILTLADTGLRISEACALTRGDLDWKECRTVVIGKGDRQDVVRFSDRSIQALSAYLAERAKLDGAANKPLASLPLFARHDKKAGRKSVRSVEPGGMWRAVKTRVREAGLDPSALRIHDFRHYFVTSVLLSSGNLKLAQVMARHARLETTGRYTHLTDLQVDQAYDDTFNQ